MFSEFFQEQWPLFLAVFIITLVLVYSYFGDKLAGFKGVNTDEAVRLFNDDAFLLDVRTAGEYKEGFIGEALNISVSEIDSNMNKMPKDKETSILVYCQTGARSSKAAARLAKEGYQNVFNLNGGIAAWQTAGLPVVRKKPSKKKKKQA